MRTTKSEKMKRLQIFLRRNEKWLGHRCQHRLNPEKIIWPPQQRFSIPIKHFLGLKIIWGDCKNSTAQTAPITNFQRANFWIHCCSLLFLFSIILTILYYFLPPAYSRFILLFFFLFSQGGSLFICDFSSTPHIST